MLLPSEKSEHYPGLLYAIAGEQTRLVKLGRTRGSADGRLRELQPNSPDRLIVVATARRWNVEQRLHRRLARYRLHNEWFSTRILASIEWWLATGQTFETWVDKAAGFGRVPLVPATRGARRAGSPRKDPRIPGS